MTAEITLDDQAKGTGSMAISVNKQIASLAGIGSTDAFEAQVTESQADLPPNSTLEISESDTDYTATVTFTDTVMDDDEFKAERLDNGNVKFTFVNEGSEPTASEEDVFGDVDMGNVTLTVNFPGEVTEFSGDGATRVDADTVKWVFPLTTSTTATATSLVSGSSFPILGLGLGLASLALVAGAVIFALRRRDPANDDVPAAEPVDEAVATDIGPSGDSDEAGPSEPTPLS